MRFGILGVSHTVFLHPPKQLQQHTYRKIQRTSITISQMLNINVMLTLPNAMSNFNVPEATLIQHLVNIGSIFRQQVRSTVFGAWGLPPGEHNTKAA